MVLISIDSLRSDHLGVYGYERDTSPVIDEIAAEGAIFLQALAPSPWTLPSHATLLTGQPPLEHGVFRHNLALNPRTTTLAEALHARGYRTAGFVSGPYLRSLYGFDQGFDVYDESAMGTEDTVSRVETSSALQRASTQWLARSLDRDPRAPFFLFVHMWDPHHDYLPPQPWKTRFDPGYVGPADGIRVETDDRVRADMPRRDLDHLIAMYDAEIRHTDESIGKLVDFLRERGVLDDTIVVITSDHGEEFFEHGNKTHAKSLFDEVLRIPLVIRYPRAVLPGTRIPHQVRLMDVGRTILALTGHTDPSFGTHLTSPNRDRDLSPWITGVKPIETFPTLLAFGHTTTNSIQSSVRSERLKVVTRRGPGSPSTAVFDLRRDRGETKNRWPEAQNDREVRRLIAEGKAWKRIWRRAREESPPVRIDLQDDQTRRLRALGYIE